MSKLARYQPWAGQAAALETARWRRRQSPTHYGHMRPEDSRKGIRMQSSEAPDSGTQSRRINPWLVTTIVLSVLLLALGTWVIIDRRSAPTRVDSAQTAGQASSAVREMLKARIDAMNRTDGQAAGAFYAEDAVLEEYDQDDPVINKGRAAIAEHLGQLTGEMGLRMEQTGEPIQYDRYVAEPVRFYPATGSGTGAGMLVFEIDSEGKIAHQWAIGWWR